MTILKKLLLLQNPTREGENNSFYFLAKLLSKENIPASRIANGFAQ